MSNENNTLTSFHINIVFDYGGQQFHKCIDGGHLHVE